MYPGLTLSSFTDYRYMTLFGHGELLRGDRMADLR